MGLFFPSVNLFNGNLTLSVPIGCTYSDDGGLAYGLLLTYNSNVWDFATTWYSVNGQSVSYRRADPGEDFNAGLGFTLSLGRLHSGGSSTAWRYVGADAAEHVFYGTLHVGETVTSNVYYTRDGSYLRLKTSSFESGSGLPLVAEVEFPDGRIQRFTRAVGTAPFRLAAIKDRFTNQVSVTYPTPVAPVTEKWQISDGYRTHTVELKTRSNGSVVVDNVKLAAFGGTTATYTFAYSDTTISRSCLDDDPESLGGSPATGGGEPADQRHRAGRLALRLQHLQHHLLRRRHRDQEPPRDPGQAHPAHLGTDGVDVPDLLHAGPGRRLRAERPGSHHSHADRYQDQADAQRQRYLRDLGRGGVPMDLHAGEGVRPAQDHGPAAQR